MLGVDLQLLIGLLKNNSSTVLPTALSIKLARFKREVDANLDIYREVLTKLVNNCAQMNDNGTPIIDENGNILLKPEKQQEWQEHYSDLENTKLNVSITFTNDEIEKLKLTPAEAEVMLKLIKDPEN